MSEQLLRNKEKILLKWEARARSEVAATRNQTSLALRNTLPKILHLMVQSLADPKKITPLRDTFSKEHGTLRATMFNYSVDQVIAEFHILREVVFEVLETDAPMNKKERDIIINVIEQAVNDAATNFSNILRDVRERFFATIMHDLRTPLTTATLGAQLIIMRSDKPEFCRQTAAKIIKSMERGNRLINDLLDISKLQAGQGIEFSYENFDLNLLLNEVVAQSTLQFGDRFILDSPGVLDVRMSLDGIRRVLENLVSNAAKYGDPLKPITVTTKQVLGRITITVHNEGNPIPDEDQIFIFQPYRRGTTTSGQKGWGLGLLLTKGIVEAHGGIVCVESSKESGTNFIIDIPRYAQSKKMELRAIV